MRRWICTILYLVLCAYLALPVSADGYTVSIPAEEKIAGGGTVTIPVTVSGGNYNAVDMRFTFDPAKLVYASSSLSSDKITVTQGAIRVRLYGAVQTSGTTAFSLTFQLPAGKTEASEVKIVARDAYVDNSAHALGNDAPIATVTNEKTKIIVDGYSVTLPSGFKGSATAYPGKDYTFSKPSGSKEYTVFATVNGKTVTCKKNGDGTYTIEAKYITGPIVITARESLVTPGTGGNNNHFVPGSGGTTGSTTAGTTVTSKAGYKQLWVQPYVELDNATVFLIAVSGTPKSGQTYAYNGDPMYFTEKYRSSGAVFGESVYLYLQIVKGGEPLLGTDVAGRITAVKGISPAIETDMDMDGSGKVDTKDAKLVYNVYNAMYWDFDDLPMASFLEADTNQDGVVNIKDADVVVDGRSAQ